MTKELELVLEELEEQFAYKEKDILKFLINYTEKDTGLILNNETEMQPMHIAYFTNTEIERVKEILQFFNANDFIWIGSNSESFSSRKYQYFINPLLYRKSYKINKVLKTMFKNYKIRCKGNVAWENLDDGI